jgi:predicted nucleic acid-binding protein
MSLIVVDASVWVARLVPQDAFHPAVRDWMAAQRALETLMAAPGLLLAEVAGALARRTGDPDLARRSIAALQNLPELRLVEMDRTLIQHAAELAARQGLRGADACYVAVAADLDLPLATLDDDQRRRASPVVQIYSFQ